MSITTLFGNAQIATMTSGKSYGLIENGAVVISDDWRKNIGIKNNLQFKLYSYLCC
jgi:hypothetical protein